MSGRVSTVGGAFCIRTVRAWERVIRRDSLTVRKGTENEHGGVRQNSDSDGNSGKDTFIVTFKKKWNTTARWEHLERNVRNVWIEAGGKAEAQYRTRSTIYTVGSSGRNAVVT